MNSKHSSPKKPAKQVVRDIRRAAPSAFFCGRQDQDRAGRIARRGQHCRAVSQGGYRPEPVLHMVKGVHGSRQAAAGG